MNNRKEFYRFVIPSMLSMFGMSVYYIVEGIIVGNWISLSALGSISIALPYCTFVSAITMLVTMGGATVTSIQIGKQENEQASSTFSLSLVILLIFLFVTCLIAVVFPEQLATLLGADAGLLADAAIYLRYYLAVAIFTYGAVYLSVIVRVDGSPELSSISVIAGMAASVFFIWLLVYQFELGMTGAALAPGFGNLLSCLLMLSHFVRKKGCLRFRWPRFEKNAISEIFKTGTPEFVMQLYSPIAQFCFNTVAMNAFGDLGVSAYSTVSYVTLSIFGLFTGISEGMQPLISMSYGEGDLSSQKETVRRGLLFGEAVAVVIVGCVMLFAEEMVGLFNPDPDLIAVGTVCFKVYAISFLFSVVNKIEITKYFATERIKIATIIASVQVVLCGLCILSLPAMLGTQFTWAGIIISEALTAVLIVLIAQRERKAEITKD